MRAKLVLAVAVGAVATFAPVSPASANCDPQIIVLDEGGGSGCSNACVETGNTVDKATAGLRERFEAVPSYWDLFACTM